MVVPDGTATALIQISEIRKNRTNELQQCMEISQLLSWRDEKDAEHPLFTLSVADWSRKKKPILFI